MLKFDDLNALKAYLFDEEEKAAQEGKEAAEKADKYKAERLNLERQKQAHKEDIARQRLEILKAKEERERAKAEEAKRLEKQTQAVYRVALFSTFLTALISFAALLAVVLRFR